MYCQEQGIELQSKGFSLEYDTNIPRQAGLSGSSAIACAALNCLMQYHDIQDRYVLCHPVILPDFSGFSKSQGARCSEHRRCLAEQRTQSQLWC